ncbi:MAG: hypothetical protein NT010_01535, partial [Proteobacteria bacterium]|nr:hypothetical protein [Pseudomonadota bacterium]
YLLLSTDVMISIGLIRHLPPDYSNNSMAITTTYFGCMSVRLKRGLLHNMTGVNILKRSGNIPFRDEDRSSYCRLCKNESSER